MTMNRRQLTKRLLGGVVVAVSTSTEVLAGTPVATPGHGTGTGTSAAYMHITNTGDTDEKLIAVHTDIAEFAEIHTVEMNGGVMAMKELKEGLEIPAGETVELKRGGYHLMLINLSRDLQEGDECTLTLEFERAGEVEMKVIVSNDSPADARVERDDLIISGAHIRPAPMLGDSQRTYGTGTSAAYMQITNHGDDNDRLVAVHTVVAEFAEIHTVEMNNGVMAMRELKEGLEIPAGETVTLARGSDHVMLINLAQDLHEGDEIALSLTFALAGEVELTVPVSASAPEGDPVKHGELEIAGAFVRPAPMLGGEATPAPPGS